MLELNLLLVSVMAIQANFQMVVESAQLMVLASATYVEWVLRYFAAQPVLPFR